jgi:prolyl-tRNA synthetase
VEQIIREEMNRAGAQEVFMPMVQPAELWKESGRWIHYGKELLRFKDRHDRDYCLGPTHEEVITEIVRHEIKTYRQLPKNLYQIQTKFRDEIRPRFGVMRCREFGMKDAYSFDADDEGVDVSYRKMFDVYQRIFTRCGLKFRAVEADTGSIGGGYSHEFIVMTDSGEDAIFFCNSCDYAANMEKAEISMPEKAEPSTMEFLPLEEIYTPCVKTIEDVCSFFQVTPDKVVKTLIFNADGKAAAILIRGDEEVNEIKVKNFLDCSELELADDELVQRAADSPKGFVGAIGIKARIVADYSLMSMSNFVMGANKEDYHIKNVNIGRDFNVDEFADLRFAKESDCCPRCKGAAKIARGVEVGHIFKLGTKYTKALKATYLDKSGKEQYMAMGCYGIGIGRTVAASIEQNHDEEGIIWPMAIAPFHVIITPVTVNDKEVLEASEKLYQNLLEQNVDVIIDDRDERAGVKFNDADLIGIPLRVTIGSKRLAEGKIELRSREKGETQILSMENATEKIINAIKEAM